MTKIEKVLYTAKAHSTGGREGGASRTSDGRLDVKLSVPGTSGPQWSPQNRPMVVRAKPANGKRPGTQLFYPAASCGGKSIFVRQLRGPHLST